MKVAFLVVILVAARWLRQPGQYPHRDANAEQESATSLTITVSESEKSTLTGDVFSFTSEITNEGSEKTPASDREPRLCSG